jgi:hypothetical protein
MYWVELEVFAFFKWKVNLFFKIYLQYSINYIISIACYYRLPTCHKLFNSGLVKTSWFAYAISSKMQKLSVQPNIYSKKRKLSTKHHLCTYMMTQTEDTASVCVCRCLQFDDQPPVEYSKQLVLSCLLHCCHKLSPDSTPMDTVNQVVNVEAVVQCIRASQNPQTHHHALLLLAHIAGMLPVSVQFWSVVGYSYLTYCTITCTQ